MNRAEKIGLLVAGVSVSLATTLVLWPTEAAANTSSRGPGVVRAAERYLGVKEDPAGSNRSPQIDRWVQAVGVPVGSEWCAAFVSAVLKEAGVKVPGTASALGLGQQFQAIGQWMPRDAAGPVPVGAVAVWDRGGGKGHVGVVVRELPGGGLETIEGNTAQSDVRRRTDRKRSDSNLVGFGLPDGARVTQARPARPASSSTILAVRGIETTSAAARAELMALAAAQGIPVDSLAAVLSAESGWNPAAINGVRHGADGRPLRDGQGRYLLTADNEERVREGKAPFFAVGLNQLTLGAHLPGFDSNAKLLQVADWPAEEQLRRVVGPYFARLGSQVRNATPGQLYMANFMSSHMHDPPDTVLGVRDSSDARSAAVYRQNRGFDHGDKGFITVADVQATANAVVSAAKGQRVSVTGIPTTTTSTKAVAGKAPAPMPGPRTVSPHYQDIADEDLVMPSFVPVDWRGLKVQVGTDAIKARVGGRLLRLPMSWNDVKALRARFDLAPMVEELSDAIWQQAGLHLSPRPGAPTDTLERVIAYNDAIDRQIPAGYAGLVADLGKDLCAHPRVLLTMKSGQKGGLCMYGWRWFKTPGKADGTPIQPKNPTLPPVHPATYRDYSHVERPVKRYATTASGDIVDLLQFIPRVLGIQPETWSV